MVNSILMVCWARPLRICIAVFSVHRRLFFSLVIAVSVLLIDLKMPHFSSRFVNAVARLCFATYLISDYERIRSWLWSSLFPFTRVGVGLGILQVLLVPTAVFAICLMLEGLRRLLVGFFIRLVGAFDLLNLTV